MKQGKRRNVKRYNGKLNVIGEKLRECREDNNLSLEKLSNKLQLMGIDIPKPSLQNIENGKRIVKEYEFYALCKVLDISMEEMLKDFIKGLD